MALSAPVCIGLKNNSQANVFRITTTASVPAGALVVILYSYIDPTGDQTVSSWSGGGLTWTKDIDIEVSSGGSIHGLIAGSAPAPSGLASSTNLDASESGRTWGANLSAFYVEGASLESDRCDGAGAIATQTGTNTNHTTGAGTISNANDVLLSQFMADGSDNTSAPSYDAPATLITGSNQHDGGNTWESAAGYRITSSSGSYTITSDCSTAHDFGDSAGWVAYKEAVVVDWPPAGSENADETIISLAGARLR